MAELYFQKFPQIVYKNTITRNITERVSIVSGQKRIPTNYQTYELIGGLRSDILANSYYKDPNLDWLIYLTNGITDPYYDWYLSTEEFDNYIVSRYGSVEKAQNDILHYRNNWYDDPITITPSGYESAADNVQKYYTPTFGIKNAILSYTRRAEDWTAATNQIVRIDINTSFLFNVGEVVDIRDPVNVVGRGTVITSNTSSVIIQHVTGNNSVNGYMVVGRDSASWGNISSSHVLSYNIPLSEQVYYQPVTSYDIENEKNESQKFLYLLNSSYALSTAEEIRRKLNQV